MKKLPLALATVLLAIPAALASAQSMGVTFTPPTLTMYVGDIKTVTVSGASTFYVGTNASPAVASAAIQGSNSLVISSYSVGTDNVSICVYGGTSVACSALGISVLKKPDGSTTSAGSNQTPTLTFDRTQVQLNVGETANVAANGSGSGQYYVSSVSDPNVVSASVTGASNLVTLTANSVGGSNVNVCQMGGTCANIYAYVPQTSTNLQAAQLTKNPIPLLSAFYASSNDVGGTFLGVGATLTFKFNTSDTVVTQSLTVAGQSVPVTGAGSGPFSGSYTVTGNESVPIRVSMDYTTAAGVSGHSSFTMGDAATAPPASAAASGAFTSYLANGSSNGQVTALQSLLKKLGIFNGPVTGNFGPLTEAAVKKYQQLRSLDQVGYVGPGTRAALNVDAAH